MRSALSFLVFTCIVLLCLTNGCRPRPSQTPQEAGGINLFKWSRNNPPRENVLPPESEQQRRIFQALQKAGSSDAKKEGLGQALRYSALTLAGIAVVIAGVLYWRTWKNKRTEWEINDPMALVKELNTVHQLSELEKRLMQELSKKNALSSPLQLFVEPKFLLAAWKDDSFTSSRSSVSRLLLQLFGIAAETGTAATVSGLNFDTIDYSHSGQEAKKST